MQPLLSRIEQKQSEKHVDNQNKSRIFDTRHTVADYYACNRAATVERMRSYICYAVADCHAFKRMAIFICVFSDVGYAVGDCYASQGTAMPERRISDTCHAVGYSYTCQGSAISERGTMYKFSVIIYGTACNIISFSFYQTKLRVAFVPEIICVVIYVISKGAFPKRIISDICHAVGDCYFFKRSTIRKRPSSMLVTPSGIVTLVKELQLLNALSPILITLSGIVILLREVL